MAITMPIGMKRMAPMPRAEKTVPGEVDGVVFYNEYSNGCHGDAG
jgi:hypothetical protein